MKIAPFIIAAILTYYFVPNKTSHSLNFQQFIRKYGKNYDSIEMHYRQIVYNTNLRQIMQHNLRAAQGINSYYMGVNQFTDLLDAEWEAIYLNKNSQTSNTKYKDQYKCSQNQPSDKDLPDSLDWAAKGAVNPVRDQGMCSGADYAITAVQAVESAYFITTGKHVQLSSQQLIDCSAQYGNRGCIAGNMTNSYAYLTKMGIASEKKYPYRGFAYNCTYTISMRQTQILGCTHITPQKQISIKAGLRRQPLAVSINAAKLKNYEKGVFETSNPLIKPCKKDPNQWMVLVGYGRDESGKKNFWKLKNSWGVNWGQQGYLFIVRKGDGQGECGVQSQLYYPLA